MWQIQQRTATKKEIEISPDKGESLELEESADTCTFITLEPQPKPVVPQVKIAFEDSTEALKHCSAMSMLFEWVNHMMR